MLEKGYLISKDINKENREEYLKAFIIAGIYDVDKLEQIFSRSKKTMYKDIKRLKDVLGNEIKSFNNVITDEILQNYINFVYKTIYSSISFVNRADRRKLIRGIIKNFESNYNVEFIDENPIVLKESQIKIGMKEKILYLNQYYNSESNFLFLDEVKIHNFTKCMTEILKKNYKLINEDELLLNLFNVVRNNWIGYKYNILENSLESYTSNYPQIEILLKSIFNKENMNINISGINKLTEIIIKHIYVPQLKINILTDDKEVKKIVEKQLLTLNEKIHFTSYTECDVQIIPRDLEISKQKIETNVIFNKRDIDALKEIICIK